MPKNFLKFNKAVIAGWNLKKMDFWRNTHFQVIKTPYGKVPYFTLRDCIFIPRHGLNENIPPHQINHLANISAVKRLGVKYVFSFNSVGSLKENIKPGELLVASDYIDFNPPTFFEKEAQFVIPELSLELREKLIKILNKLKLKFKNGGVYFLAKGPRLETKAEIIMMRSFADVVGMTMAKEATLAKELGLEYISLCAIDNYAHGLVKKSLTIAEIKGNQAKTKEKFEKIIKEITNESLN